MIWTTDEFIASIETTINTLYYARYCEVMVGDAYCRRELKLKDDKRYLEIPAPWGWEAGKVLLRDRVQPVRPNYIVKLHFVEEFDAALKLRDLLREKKVPAGSSILILPTHKVTEARMQQALNRLLSYHFAVVEMQDDEHGEHASFTFMKWIQGLLREGVLIERPAPKDFIESLKDTLEKEGLTGEDAEMFIEHHQA